MVRRNLPVKVGRRNMAAVVALVHAAFPVNLFLRYGPLLFHQLAHARLVAEGAFAGLCAGRHRFVFLKTVLGEKVGKHSFYAAF
jgi:hypothetical protein